jgi:hypothetical protein
MAPWQHCIEFGKIFEYELAGFRDRGDMTPTVAKDNLLLSPIFCLHLLILWIFHLKTARASRVIGPLFHIGTSVTLPPLSLVKVSMTPLYMQYRFINLN